MIVNLFPLFSLCKRSNDRFLIARKKRNDVQLFCLNNYFYSKVLMHMEKSYNYFIHANLTFLIKKLSDKQINKKLIFLFDKEKNIVILNNNRLKPYSLEIFSGFTPGHKHSKKISWLQFVHSEPVDRIEVFSISYAIFSFATHLSLLF